VRTVFLLFSLLFSSGFFTTSYAAPQDMNLPPPYKMVGPFKEDANRVIVFFAFDCDHCREMLPAISKWGATLPKNIKFELMPVTSPDPRYLIPSRAWYAALATGAPDATMELLAEQAMSLVQTNGMSITSPDTWRHAVAYAGIRNFEAAWKAVPPSVAERAIKKLSDYQVNSTPTIMIGGRYVITPDNTNGDMGLFMQLASGLVSAVIAH
jgi:thiol:disulfide interchange protein DsbA